MAEIGSNIAFAKQLLESGELVAIPTETVYGLAGNALNEKSVLNIFKVKNRPAFDPLIVHVANLAKAKEVVDDFCDKAEKLATQYWPGPLTLLLKKKSHIPDLVTSGLETVGVRCPDHVLTQSLLQQLSFPLAAPSANPFGYISPTRPEHVNEQLGDQIGYILDGGECRVGMESTIVGFDLNDLPVVYRLGGLSIENIESIVGKVSVQLNTSSNPLAPGQLKSHYAPKKKLLLGDLEELTKVYRSRVGILAFQKEISTISSENQLILSQRGDLDEAAQRLFASLRTLDKLDIDIILAEEVPNVGLGKAINDRLRRAATDHKN